MLGRDITLGQHQAPPIQLTGKLETIRMSKNRLVLCMAIQMRKNAMSQPRIVEILL